MNNTILARQATSLHARVRERDPISSVSSKPSKLLKRLDLHYPTIEYETRRDLPDFPDLLDFLFRTEPSGEPRPLEFVGPDSAGSVSSLEGGLLDFVGADVLRNEIERFFPEGLEGDAS